MSLLPGEMTKQSLRAPPLIIRSIRYSDTAFGRSTPPTHWLPTGSSSFEKASGWMRLPIPAAGMMPHMLGALVDRAGARSGAERRGQARCLDQFLGAALRGVLGQHP